MFIWKGHICYWSEAYNHTNCLRSTEIASLSFVSNTANSVNIINNLFKNHVPSLILKKNFSCYIFKFYRDFRMVILKIRIDLNNVWYVVKTCFAVGVYVSSVGKQAMPDFEIFLSVHRLQIKSSVNLINQNKVLFSLVLML